MNTIWFGIIELSKNNYYQEYLCIISIDVGLKEEEIIRIYGKHWDIKVFFKVCKAIYA